MQLPDVMNFSSTCFDSCVLNTDFCSDFLTEAPQLLQESTKAQTVKTIVYSSKHSR